ncbi:hypothetical protein HCA64_03130 [Listeria booriae]|uniref:Uncharacterized protein n=1 Tax=Listeria booriae TaxID=1552123 RepID=A0A099W434_9LIST|nr:hypothetical protein [Listeria booriae]KGL40524.1 hypothetical protein EP57_08180 [Listeria booriae]MBC1905464.1 hypothetical protein [Listeria booriae]MBC1914011.1 hypothetical protein [Listeria booriae]MBC2242475.1 hypothetical protein [Listeria booriae]STY41941.1 Uncharacterised protein [Listeria booriae]
MSIGIIVDEPRSDDERLFFIPVATEEAFKKYWLKASQDMQLMWVPIFESGVVIEAEDLEAIVDELKKVKVWSLENIENLEIQKGAVDRIDYIIGTLPKGFAQRDTKLYIG